MEINATPWSRAKASAVARWYLLIPTLLIGAELLLHRWHPLLPLYLRAAVASHPALSIQTLLYATARAWVCYAAFALTAELALRPLLRQVRTRMSAFLIGNAIWVAGLLLERPNFTSAGGARLFLPLLALLAVGSRLPRGETQRVRRLLPALAGLVLLLAMTRVGDWHSLPPQPAVKAKTGAPSFLLLGFDGVPGDLVPNERLTPLWWNKWRARSLEFTNAYSVTNSTFTSWYSILSGQYPERSGIRSLFPASRKSEAVLLTESLRRAGYRSVFLTDCSNTSFAEPDLGFDRWHQPGKGFLDCADAYFSAVHPLTYAARPFFPREDSFCSPLYSPDRFIARVRRTLTELQTGEAPFLLVAHSCATQHAYPHPPPKHSALWRDLPPAPVSQPDLLASLRWMDGAVDAVLEGTAGPRPIWSFVLSDHGVHADSTGKHLSHGVGLPVGRLQYHVPLLALPPPGHSPRRVDSLVSLLDLAPTISRLAGAPGSGFDGIDLEQAPADRALLLASALDPLPEKRDASVWRMDDRGVMAFSVDFERTLRTSTNRAVVKLPYRLLKSPSGKVRLYDELADPGNERDLSAQMPSIVRELETTLVRLSSDKATREGRGNRQFARHPFNGRSNQGRIQPELMRKRGPFPQERRLH